MNGPDLARRIQEAMIETDEDACFAVAFLGQDFTELLGIDSKTACKIVCDFTSGGTNPKVLDSIKGHNIEVRHLDGLHAKMGHIGNKLSFVGSSNFSKNGLKSKDQQGCLRHERNVVFEGGDDSIKTDLSSLWCKSVVISDEMIVLAKSAYLQRLKNDRTKMRHHSGKSLIAVLRHDPAWLDELNVHFLAYPKPTEEEEDQHSENEKIVLEVIDDEEAHMYWDWVDPAFPSKAYLVDFQIGNRDGLDFQDLYRRDVGDVPDQSVNGHTYQIVHRISKIQGTTCSAEDRKQLIKAFKKYRLGNSPDDDDAWCFPISELSQYMDASK